MQERSAMLLADVGRALVIGALAAAALHPALGLWMLALAAAIAGVLTVMFELARSAWMARRIAHAQLPARAAQER
jgi:hypothetical protein